MHCGRPNVSHQRAMTLNPERKLILLAVLQLLLACDDEDVAMGAAVSLVPHRQLENGMCRRKNGGSVGRTWEHSQNNKGWFCDYALNASFERATWLSLFRVPRMLFMRLLLVLRADLSGKTTSMREPISPELKLASFLMYVGEAACSAVACQLGLGPSTVCLYVKQVSRSISSHLIEMIKFPEEEEDLARVMSGFQDIRGLPYCAGAIDGTHIPWPSCREDQFYEYRGYKGFTSIVLFAMSDARRRFLFKDIGRPGMFGDSIIFDNCELKANINCGKWLGSGVPDLKIGNIVVRPYLIGDCAFKLAPNMMKTSSKSEINANPVLRIWDDMASQTRKPIECPFGILKNCFNVLQKGVRLQHEDDISYLVLACVILQNMCVDCNDDSFQSLPPNEAVDDVLVTAESSAGKKQRDALIYYVLNGLHD